MRYEATWQEVLVVFDFCPCRYGEECKEYPVDIGCLLTGDSVLRPHDHEL